MVVEKKKAIGKQTVSLNYLPRASEIITPHTGSYSFYTAEQWGLHLAVWAPVRVLWICVWVLLVLLSPSVAQIEGLLQIPYQVRVP